MRQGDPENRLVEVQNAHEKCFMPHTFVTEIFAKRKKMFFSELITFRITKGNSNMKSGVTYFICPNQCP